MSVPFSRKSFVDKPMKVRGRLFCQQTLADVGNVSRYVYFLNPIQFGTTKVLDDLAHEFVWFRFTKLRVVLGEMAAESATILAVGYLPYPPTTLATGIDDVVESGECCLVWSSDSVLGEMTLSRSTLGQNQPKWFRVEPTGDDYLEYQGILQIVDTSQGAVDSVFVLEYEIEFLTLADDPLTPSPVRPGVAHEPSLVKVPKGHWERDAQRARQLRRARFSPKIHDLLEANGHRQPIVTSAPLIERSVPPSNKDASEYELVQAPGPLPLAGGDRGARVGSPTPSFRRPVRGR